MSCTSQLACPVCGEALGDLDGSARCAEGHSFDYARSGYLNLTRTNGARGRAADTAAMVAARARFLAAGHYVPVAAAVAEAAAGAPPGLIVELGAGTGYYLGTVSRHSRAGGGRIGCGIGIDLSKAAAAHAARAHPDLRFVVADVEERIPLRDASADLALSVFAPRPGAELGRVVRPGGELVAAFAGPRHLQRLRERLGLMGVGERKLERLGERLGPWFDLLSTEMVEFGIALDVESAQQLVLMGPNAWHDVDSAMLGEGLEDTVSVVLARFRRHAPEPESKSPGPRN